MHDAPWDLLAQIEKLRGGPADAFIKFLYVVSWAGWLSYIAVIVAANSLLISGGVDMRTPTKAVRMHLNTRQYASNADHHHCVDALFWTTP